MCSPRRSQGLPCACLQVDEANIPGNPADGPLAAAAINRVLDAFEGRRAVHLCFGNYGGQTIQQGEWRALTAFLNALHVDHLVLEMAHRPSDDLAALSAVDPRIRLGIGVVDVKVNHVETPEEIARRIECAARIAGPDRIGWVHPDCGFWMLKRSVADRKIAALVAGPRSVPGSRMSAAVRAGGSHQSAIRQRSRGKENCRLRPARPAATPIRDVTPNPPGSTHRAQPHGSRGDKPPCCDRSARSAASVLVPYIRREIPILSKAMVGKFVPGGALSTGLKWSDDGSSQSRKPEATGPYRSCTCPLDRGAPAPGVTSAAHRLHKSARRRFS